MKKLLENRIVQIGVMAFLVIAAAILFYYLIFLIPSIWKFLCEITSILMPLIFGLILAYIMHPIVRLFESKVFVKLKSDTAKRNLSILCTIVVIVGVIVALISVIIPQLLLSIQSLIVNVPAYAKNVETALLDWLSNSEVEETVLDNYDDIIGYITSALNDVVLPATNSAISNLSKGIFGVFSFIFNFAIGTVFAVYILANTKNFGAGIRKTLYSIFNVERVNDFIDEVKHINHVFGQFMIGKICDSSIVALCTLVFLLIFHYPYALLIAVIIGLTDLIPYFGPYIGSVPSALLICLVDPVKALTFILFMIVLQQIDGNLITPRIQKQATGLPSFWVLFSITLFGGLFGLIGLLIAVPCFTIIYELFCDNINKRLRKKNMPIDEEFYTDMKSIEEKKIKAKI